MSSLIFNRVDITGILEGRLQIVEGKTVLYIPLDPDDDRKDKNLIVVLSPIQAEPRFFGISSFLNDQRTDLLFITDPMDSWYLEADSGETFSRVLSHFCSRYQPENVMIFGHSTAGYGALFHGVRLSVNVMATDPQIDRVSIEQHGSPALKACADKVSSFIDLMRWIPEHHKNSAIYIACGPSPLSSEAAQRILYSDPLNGGKLIFQTEKQDILRSFYSSGRLTHYVYTAYDLLKILRVDLPIVRTKKKLPIIVQVAREPRRLSPLLPHPSKTRWYDRFGHSRPGVEMTFADCGLYDEQGKIGGLRCRYRDGGWEALSVPRLSSGNLLANSDFSKWSRGEGPFTANQSLTADSWKLQTRSDAHCAVRSDDGSGLRATTNPDPSNRSVLTQGISCGKAKLRERLSDRIITVCGDFWVEQGEACLEILLRGADGAWRKHLTKTTKTEQWERLTVHHRAPVDLEYLRVNLIFPGNAFASLVRVRRVVALVGYFPMGFPIDTVEMTTSRR